MGRQAKHNWKKLYLEYCQGRYKNMTEFAQAKNLPIRPVQKEFKKLQLEAEASVQNELKKTTKNDPKKVTEKRKRPKNDRKEHAWEKLKKQFLDWPDDKLQAYVEQLNARKEELEAIPFEELTPEEIKELGRVRQERRVILSDPDPEVRCHAHNRDGSSCGNPVERGKKVCWNHGGAPGSGCQPGQKNALKHGAYETIWADALEDDEKELLNLIPTDPFAQIDDKIRVLSIRERRMMKRIQTLMSGLTENERRLLHERKNNNSSVTVYDENTGGFKTVNSDCNNLVLTEVREIQFRAIDDILRLEEALTKVQDKLIRAIDIKHRMIQKGLGSEEHQLRLEKMKQDITISREKIDLEKAKRANGDDGETTNNERIMTLAQLINNPVPDRRVEDFEEDD